MLRQILAATGCSIALLAPHAASCQQAIKIVVPFAAGGPTDVVGRTLAIGLQKELNSPVVVENKPGAQGVLGVTAVKDAKPDGTTLLLHEITGSFAVLPAMSRSPTYDGQKDFSPIGMVASGPIFLLVHQALPARDLRELVAYSKTVPGGLTFGSSGGLGQMPTHMGPEILKLKSGMIARNIIYRGAGPAMIDLAAGRVDFMFTTGLGAAMPFLESGKIRALAVTSKSAALPSVPTFAEAGFPVPELAGGTTFGLWGPVGLSSATISALNQGLNRVLSGATFRAQLGPLLMTPYTPGSPQVLSDVVSTEIATWTPIVRKLNLQTE